MGPYKSEVTSMLVVARAFSYLRFSTPEQLKGDSFRRQTTMAREYAARNGLALDTELTFEDLGVSAFRGANAEAGRLADFLEAVRVGLVPRGSYLLVEALDRLSRLSPRKALRVLEDIVEEGVTVVTLNDGKAYTADSLDSDPTSLLIAIVTFMRANEESETKARRLRAAWEGKRLKATDRPLTAQVPAWIQLNRTTGALELIEDRSQVIRRIFADYVAGTGLDSIAKALTREGVPCFGRAAHWHRSYLLKIVRNPAVHGTYVPHRYVHEGSRRRRQPLAPVEGYYPAAIEKEVFDTAQGLGGTTTTPRSRTGQVVSLLAGLAACPLCAATMTRVTKGTTGRAGKPFYVCTKAKVGAGCTYRAVSVQAVEDALLSNPAYLVASAPSGSSDIDDEFERVSNSVDALSDAAANLLEALEAGPSAVIGERLREIERELEDQRARRDELLEQMERASGPLVAKRLRDLETALTASPVDKPMTNAALRLVLARVVLDYEAGEAVMHWKHGGASSVLFAFPRRDAYGPSTGTDRMP